MEREREHINQLDARILGIGPASDATARRVEKLGRIHYRLFGDPRGDVYALFGFRKVLAVVQQSGAAVIDRDGVVRYLHRTANPQAALQLDEVIQTLERLGVAAT